MDDFKKCGEGKFPWSDSQDCSPGPDGGKHVNSAVCGNLVQDPSFEADFGFWFTDNVGFEDTAVFEGTAVARLGPGVASLYQNLDLKGANEKPLFFSFNAVGGPVIAPNGPASEAETNQNEEGVRDVGIARGSLIAEVIWLDRDFNAIGTGLRMFIPDGRINNQARITFFGITDRPPAGTSWARIQFSKGQGNYQDIILLDQVVLAPICSTDLVQNGDFEAGLLNWTAQPDTAFISDHKLSLESAGHVRTHFNGRLIQDVPIQHLKPGSTFLLSFAAGGEGPVGLVVRVEWLDANGNPIGSGLNLTIPNGTLPVQGNYLSYLNITERALPGTATARLIFAATVPASQHFLLLDQVIFAPLVTNNLIENPSFANGFNDWTPVYVTLVPLNDVYEGSRAAGIGEIGGSLVQDVELEHPTGHCFLFSTGLGFRRTASNAVFGTMLMKVIWLDRYDREIGLGLCLIGTSTNQIDSPHYWVPYAGITEPAPPDTAKARIQFTKTLSDKGFIEIDNVVFGRLI